MDNVRIVLHTELRPALRALHAPARRGSLLSLLVVLLLSTISTIVIISSSSSSSIIREECFGLCSSGGNPYRCATLPANRLFMVFNLKCQDLKIDFEYMDVYIKKH